MGLDTACPQPAGEPEAVPTGLEGDGNAVDLVTRLLRLCAPPIEQLYEFILIGRELLERLALDARYDPSNEPDLFASSITAINVWLGSNGVSEWLRSLSGFFCFFGLRIDGLHRPGCYARRWSL